MYTLHLGTIHLPIKKMFLIKKRKKAGILKNNYLKLLINMFTEQGRGKKKKNHINFFFFYIQGYMLISLPFLLQCYFQLSKTTAHTTAINFMPLLTVGPLGSCMNYYLMCFEVSIKAHSLLSFLMDLLLPLLLFCDDVRPQKGRPLELTFEK